MTQPGPTRHPHGAWYGAALALAGLPEAIRTVALRRGGMARAIVPAASVAPVAALRARRSRRGGIA